MATSKEKSKIKVGQWVFLGPGEFAIKAKVIEGRGTVGYDKEPAFLLLVPAEEPVIPGEEAPGPRTTVAVESRLIPA